MDLNFLQENDIVDVISPGSACDFNEIIKIKDFIKGINLKPNIFLEKETTLTKPANHEFSSFPA